MIGSRVWVWFNDKLTVDGQILDNYFDRSKARPAPRADRAADARLGDPLPQHLPPRDRQRRSQRDPRQARRRRRLQERLQRQRLHRLGRPDRRIRSEGRRDLCKPDKGGTIHTDEEYGDFEARSNSSSRPPATTAWPSATPARATPPTSACASCRSSTTPPRSIRTLDPRQYCCSIYGVVPAHRGYLRPAGRVELRARHHQGPHDQGRAERQRRDRRRREQGPANLHGQQRPPRPDAHEGFIRLRRPQ